MTAVPPQEHAPPGDELDVRLRGRHGSGGLVLRLRVVPAALLLTAVHLLVTATRLARSWWWQDDLNILADAARRPLSPGLLFSDYNGHLVPGSWLLAWVFDRVAPLQWWPAALVTFAMVAALDVTLLALLRRMFGTRPAILVPFGLYCGTTLMLTSTVWWAAAMQWLPASLALAAGLYFHVGFLRTGDRRQAAGAVAAVLFGVLFFEKAVTTTLVLALYTVLYAVPGPLWLRPFVALRRWWGYWLAHGVVLGGFLWLYFARVTITTGPTRPGLSAQLDTVRIMLLETFLPSLVGGPLNWFSPSTAAGNSWPHPPLVLTVIAAALTTAAVVGSLVFVRGAWRAWALLGVFLAVSVALVVRARLGFIGPFIGRDHRYLTDAAVMAPIGLALAWLPLRDDAVLATRPPRELRWPEAGRWRAAGPGQLRQHLGLAVGAGALAVVVMTLGGLVSGERFMSTWARNPSQEYMDNLAQGLRARAAAGAPTYLFDDAVAPDLVMQPTFLDDRRLGHLTRPMRVRPITGAVLPAFMVVDDQGNLHAGVLRGPAAAPVGPGSNCATAGRPATMALPADPGYGRWKLSIGYLANRQTTARVRFGLNPPVTMRLDRGLHSVYLSLFAGGAGATTLTLGGLDEGASVCIGGATLGFPVAAQ